MIKPDFEDKERGVQLYCGDALKLLPEFEDGSIEMVWMDPPYGHANQDGDLQSARVGVKGGRQAEPEPIQNDGKELRPMMDEVFKVLWKKMKPDCCCCCCCCGGGGPTPTFAWFADRMDQYPWSFFHALVWDKSARGDGMGWRYRRNYEFVMVAHIRGGKLLWGDDASALPNVFRDAPPKERLHPNQKPVSLVCKLIKAHSPSCVVDPFMGSGTTGIACLRTGRRFIGIEIDPKYFAIAVDRIKRELAQLVLL